MEKYPNIKKILKFMNKRSIAFCKRDLLIILIKIHFPHEQYVLDIQTFNLFFTYIAKFLLGDFL